MLIAITAGVLAGRLGRALLLRRGVPVPPLCCEGGVAAAWCVVQFRIASGMPWWWAGIPLALGWAGTLLAVCDVRTGRLPDVLTLPAYPVSVLLLAVAASHRPGLLGGATVGFVLFAGTYLLVRLISPAALGPGDVKLAGPLGALVGAVSIPGVVLVMTLAAVGTVLIALVLRRGSIPHGPAMLLPAWLATLS